MFRGTPCRKVREELAAYAEGWLPTARAAEIEEHLRACPDCARAARADAAVVRAVAALQPETPRPLSWQEVLAARQQVPRRTVRALRWSPAFATAALLLLAVWEYAPRGGRAVNPPPVAVAPVQAPQSDSGTFVLAHATVSVAELQADPNRAILMAAGAEAASR